MDWGYIVILLFWGILWWYIGLKVGYSQGWRERGKK